MANFAVELSPYPCACGMPNIGAFRNPASLSHLFPVTSPQHRCSGPSSETIFRDAGRAFQAEIYLGAAAGQSIRTRLLAMLESPHIAAGFLPGRAS